jgi:hypothetical protein
VGKAAGADHSYPSIDNIENCRAIPPCHISLHGIMINGLSAQINSFYEGCGVLRKVPLKITVL